jgi:SAM-dependent methyltransferase
MDRSFAPELMDDPAMPQREWELAQRGIARMCRSFGNHAAVLRALKRDPAPVRSVLDVGCGSGELMRDIRRRLGVDVVGVDLRAPQSAGGLRIFEADAVRDPLPRCDVAVSVWMAHHLSGTELVELIRNVGRSARRLVLLDLVRHPLPLALFRTFATPFLSRVNAEDGIRSIRRSFTPAEMRAAAAEALDGAGAAFSHSVAPLRVRQVLDVRYGL